MLPITNIMRTIKNLKVRSKEIPIPIIYIPTVKISASLYVTLLLCKGRNDMFSLSIFISAISFNTLPAEKQQKKARNVSIKISTDGRDVDANKSPITVVIDEANPFHGLPNSNILKNLFFENNLAKNLSIKLIVTIYY